MLKVEYLEKIPKWWNERKYYDLVLSNDIDSFMTCEVLKQVKGWDINYFYTFDSMGLTDSVTSNEYIGVDISFNQEMKCFDNHVVMLNEHDYCNSKSINFNVADKISRINYFNKYCGSTLLMVWALYDLPLPESEEGKMILLAIDSTFKGFYSPYLNDKTSNKHYLDAMGFYELYEVLKRHKQTDFIKLIRKYNLSSNIEAKKGYLQTDIDLEELRKVFDLPFLLPEKKFYCLQEYENKTVSLNADCMDISKDDVSESIYSIALTKRNFLNYSVLKGDSVMN